MGNFLKHNLLKVIIGVCLAMLLLAIFFVKNKKTDAEQSSSSFEKPLATDYEGESFSFEDMINSNDDAYFGDIEEKKPPKKVILNPFDENQNERFSEEKKEETTREIKKEEPKYIPPKKKVKKKKTNPVKAIPTPPAVKKSSIEEQLIARRSNREKAEVPIDVFVQATAAVNENQTIYENSIVTVRLLEDAVGNNHTIKKNTYLYGVATFNQKGRLFINFNNINDHGETRSINLKAYDFLDGYEGLIITDPDVVNVLKSQTNDQVTSEISSQGTVGRILSGVMRKKKTTIKITLYDEHQIILKGTL